MVDGRISRNRGGLIFQNLSILATHDHLYHAYPNHAFIVNVAS